MKLLKYWFSVISIFCFIQSNQAQDVIMEIGAAVGNIAGQEHSLGKGEIHLNILKSLKFGQIGLDFSNGGNFIPGSRSTEEGNTEILSPNDSKFVSIAFLYRLPIKKYLFVEPRLGYTSLYSYVHTDDRRTISQSNFSAGIGIGAVLKNISFSLRYQYLGETASYEGSRDNTIVRSTSEALGIVLLGISYQFSLDSLFGK